MTRSIWEGQKVRLRAREPEDWQVHAVWGQDTEAARTGDRIEFPLSREFLREGCRARALREPRKDYFDFCIETLDGTLVGSINSWDVDQRNGTLQYGIAVRREYQGRGYASEAVKLFLRFFFRELRYQKVNASIYEFNDASRILQERLGFQLEARLRQVIYTAGRHWDEYVYGLTAEEFDQLYPDY